jgi:hypothetical protein
MARSDQVRHQLFLPRALSERVEALARAPGVTRSSLLAAAMTQWLERGATDELELRFARRLDRLSAQLERIERDGHVQIESLALFVRYMLTVNAPLAEEDEMARSIGRDRFEVFIGRVGRQLASGRRSFEPEAGR